jgi:catechol 2,3-dioxygenase-like lactoylglutathione lyase family enzyme
MHRVQEHLQPEDSMMSGTETPKAARTVFEGVTPILRVRSLAAGIDYYVRVLGFKVDWQAPFFASVSRGRCGIFLSEGDQGNPGSWVWVGVEDAEALFEEYRSQGARIRHPPTNYPWACEMQIDDPDGNVLRLGSEPKTDRPFGEWLDMRGDRWAMSPSGGWTRAVIPGTGYAITESSGCELSPLHWSQGILMIRGLRSLSPKFPKFLPNCSTPARNRLTPAPDPAPAAGVPHFSGSDSC